MLHKGCYIWCYSYAQYVTPFCTFFIFSFASFLFAVVVRKRTICYAVCFSFCGRCRKRTICYAVCFSFLFFSHIGVPENFIFWGEQRQWSYPPISGAVWLFTTRLSNASAKVQLFFELCVPQFWNGTCVRRFHELYGAVNSTPRNMKTAREFGITHRAMRFVKRIILHPLGIVGRKSVIFDENAQFSTFFFAEQILIFCHKYPGRRDFSGTTCPRVCLRHTYAKKSLRRSREAGEPKYKKS